MHVVTFIKPHLGSKCHIFRRGTKSTGEEKAIKMMWLSHHAACCPLSLHHQSFPFPLAMMLFLCHPMWEGGGGEGGHRGQTQRGNQSSLSLCVIQYHACVPMNGCQDTEFRAKERAAERIKSLARTGPGGQFMHSWREIKRKEKRGNYEVESLTNKYGTEFRQDSDWLLEIIKRESERETKPSCEASWQVH